MVTIIKSFIACWVVMTPLQGSYKKKLLLSFLVLALFLVSEVLARLVFSLLYREPFGEPYVDRETVDLVSNLGNMIALLLITILRLAKNKSTTIKAGVRAYSLEIAVAFFCAALFGYISYFRYEAAGKISTLILLINVLVFLLYDRHSKQTQKYLLAEQQQQFKEQHYKELEAHQSEILSIKHDIKNQLIAMGAFVKAGEADRADAQLSELIAQLEESDKYTFTEHAGVNGLLARKYQQAQEAEIQCDFHITLPRATGFSDVDLIDLVGNILDNALEACQHSEDTRHIHLEIDCQDGVFLLRCTNSTDGQAKTLKTRKRDAGRHGFGMQSIKQVVEKYEGDMKYSFKQDNFEIELSLFVQ